MVQAVRSSDLEEGKDDFDAETRREGEVLYDLAFRSVSTVPSLSHTRLGEKIG